MLRTLSLLLLIVTVGYSQWRDSSRVLVPAPSGKAVKVTQFAIGDTNTWKVSGAIAYMGGNFYIANGTYYVLMAGSGSSSADTATFVTKNTTQVVSAPKYFTARQYMTSLAVDTLLPKNPSGDLTVDMTDAGLFKVVGVISAGEITDATITGSSAWEAGIIDTAYTNAVSGIDAGTNITVTSNGGKRYKISASSGGSVGNADSLGGVPASGYLLKADTAKISAGYGVGVQQSLHTATVSVDSSVIATSGTTQIIDAPKYFTAKQFMTSLDVDTISGKSQYGTYRQLNILSNSGRILAGNALTSADVEYISLFGANVRTSKSTLGGFAYANSLDTIYFGHATVSLGVPFVAANFAKPLSGGEELGAFAMFADGIADSSAFRFQQYAGVAGTGGLTTSSLMLIKTKNTSDINYGKWDGSKQYQFMYIDTSNNMYLNYAKTADWSNQGDVYVNMGNFTVTAGSVDADSMRDDGTTWRTSAAYHSGLGASSFGNISAGTISGGNITSSGTVSTTGTGAHTFATAGSGFTTYRDGGAASSHVNTYGNTNGSFYYSNTFAGTRAAPTQIGASQVLGNFMGSGYINGDSRNMAKMQYLAKSTPSATNYSSYGRFQFVPDSSTTLTTHTILDWTNLTTPRLTIGTTAGTGRGNLYIDSLYFGTTLAIDANRKHTNVGGIATTGAFGVAPQVDTVTYTSMSSGMSKNLTSTAGMYRLLYTIFCTTADAAAGSVQLTLSFNNGAAQTMTSAAVNLTSTANKDDDAFIFYVASGTPSISTAITGSAGTSKYSVHAVVERLK